VQKYNIGKKGCPALADIKRNKFLFNFICSFSGAENEPRDIHPFQGLPLYGEDAIDSGQRPPSIKDFL
jgi:hypothetical protein